MKRYFITGTDTDCGKTYVTACLTRSVPHAVALKPIASGCMEIENQLVSSDAQYLQQGSSISLDRINPWRYKLPVSPHIAAQNEGQSLSIREVADYCLNFQLEGKEHVFIEGAGGLMVPLNDQETWIDFLHYSKIPVILVVGMRLGCINHALLTTTVLASKNIDCLGWIANCLDPQMQALSANITTLTQMIDAPLLATVPFEGELIPIELELLCSA